MAIKMSTRISFVIARFVFFFQPKAASAHFFDAKHNNTLKYFLHAAKLCFERFYLSFEPA